MNKKVKKISTYIVNQDKDLKNNEIIFDLSGNEIENIFFFSNGTIESRTTSHFNEKNNKTEQISYSEENEFAEKSTFFWNENNKLEKEVIEFADDSKSIRIFERNSKDNSLTMNLIDEDDELEEREIIHFNSSGEITEKKIFDENEELVEKVENVYVDNFLRNQKEFGKDDELISEKNFTYDEKGNMIKRITLNEKNQVINSVILSYDDLNRVVEQNINNSYYIIFTFDDENRTHTEERVYPNGVLQYRKVSKYDENNLITEEDGTEGKKKYVYEFYDEIA